MLKQGATTSPPSLSVVIPTHNTKDLVMRCLESFWPPPPRVEVVVFDDGSRDGTAEALARVFPSLTVFRNPQALGFTRAANRGVESARGDIVLLLNSDTEVCAGGFEALCHTFAATADVGVAGAILSYPDGTPQWSAGREPDLWWLFGLASGFATALVRLPFYRRIRPVSGHGSRSRSVDWVSGAAMAFRREVWEAIGPLEESFRFYGQDLDFCCRARRQGWRVVAVDHFRVLHHHGATIGRGESGTDHQQPRLLWSDLLLWAYRNGGARCARRTAMAMTLGGRLRLLARAIGGLFLRGGRRADWRRETRAYRRAVDAIAGSFTMDEQTSE